MPQKRLWIQQKFCFCESVFILLLNNEQIDSNRLCCLGCFCFLVLGVWAQGLLHTRQAIKYRATSLTRLVFECSLVPEVLEKKGIVAKTTGNLSLLICSFVMAVLKYFSSLIYWKGFSVALLPTVCIRDICCEKISWPWWLLQRKHFIKVAHSLFQRFCLISSQ